MKLLNMLIAAFDEIDETAPEYKLQCMEMAD